MKLDRPIVLTAAIAGVVVTGGLTSAAAVTRGPSAQPIGDLYMCVNSSSHLVTQAWSFTVCPAGSEKFVQAKATSSGGATGATGAQGAAGAQGATGAPGDVGATGARGAAGAQGVTGTPGAEGTTGAPGAQGASGLQGPKGEKGDAAFLGAFYAAAFYNVGDTNAGAIATVACDPNSQNFTAIAGGVQVLGLGAGAESRNTPVSSSFPGRMDWTTNGPKADRLDGWIVQFGGNAGAVSDKAPEKVKVWALCIPSTNIPVTQTFTQN